MQLLTACTSLTAVHYDVFSSHKGQLSHYTLADYLLINYESVSRVSNIEHDVKYSIYSEKSLSNSDTFIS